MLPANVLIGDPSSDWLKLAAPLVLQQDLGVTQYVAVSLTADETSARQLGAQDFLRTKIDKQQGKIHVEAELVDVATQKVTRTETVDASSTASIIPALNQLAKSIDSTAGEFSTKNSEALQLFTDASQQQDPNKRYDMLNTAITKDPSFGMAYFLMLEMAAPMGQGKFQPVLDKGTAQRNSFNAYDRARFDLIAKQLNRAPLKDRVAAAEELHRVAPNDLDGLLIVGGARFQSGDTAGGAEAMRRAIELNPSNPTLKVQLAEGLMQGKRYSEAEQALAGLEQPPVLAAKAVTILMQGDTTRASAAAEKFITSVPNPDYQVVERASWYDLAGQRDKAISTIQSAKLSDPDIKGLALSQVAVWRLINKDLAGAKTSADDAGKVEKQRSPVASVARVLVAGGSYPVDYWRGQVMGLPLNDGMKQSLLAYGLFLNGHYPEAATEWRKILDASNGGDLRARAMLAGSLDRAGQTAEAKKINVQPFLVRDFADLYGSIVFGEMRRLVKN